MRCLTDEGWTESGKAVTELLLDVFRLNGRLLLAGDRLVAPLGLTSARWQIIGAIANADAPQSVAWHAHDMGVNRQGIQRIVNELEKEGIIEFRPNPHHKRARLVLLTAKGQDLYDTATALQVPWANALSEGLSSTDIATARDVVNRLKSHLESVLIFQDDGGDED